MRLLSRGHGGCDGMAAAFLLCGAQRRARGPEQWTLGVPWFLGAGDSGSCHRGFARTLTSQVGLVPTPVFRQMPPLPPPTLSVRSRGLLSLWREGRGAGQGL